MTKEEIRSLIRHIITAVGFLLGVLGLSELNGLIDIISESLPEVLDAVFVLVGFVTAILGFFKDRKRHVDREVGRNSNQTQSA